MATNTLTGIVTMLDAAKSIGANGSQLAVVDVLSMQTFMQDAHWEEADDFTTHHYMQTLSEPTGSDTVINQGITWEVGSERPVTETLQGLESYSKIDTRILKRRPQPQQYRAMKDTETVRGMRKTVDDRVLYGNSTVGVAGNNNAVSPDQILGITPRFNKISPTYDQIQGTQYWPSNVVSAAGSTANVQSSVWAVKWGPTGLYFTYPREGKGFIEVEPMPGETIVYDANNLPYKAEITHFEIGFGIAIGDWRNVQRMCNINKATDTKPWTSDLMVQMLAQFPDPDWSGIVIYANVTSYIEMLQEAKNNANSFHFDEAPWGEKTAHFMGVPIKRADRIANTEAVVA